MSSNIRIKKVCQHCRQSFIAQKTVTKFCSLMCAQRNYKKRKREEKITKTIIETNELIRNCSQESTPISGAQQTSEILLKEWINVEDFAEMLGVGKRTFYRMVKNHSFPKVRIGKRVVLNKQRVIEFLISKNVEL